MKRSIVLMTLTMLCYAAGALAAVNINTADQDQLEGLTGIGSVKAEAIIQDREDHGDYTSINGLRRVSGIGDKTVEDLREEATVGDSASE